jgi:hypothetical protein
MPNDNINYIDKNWDKKGGKIEVHHKTYQLLDVKGKYPRETKSGKAIFVKEHDVPVFAPKSMVYIHEHYKGAGNYEYMIYISPKMYAEKAKELADAWKQSEEAHDDIHEKFRQEQEELKKLREKYYGK